MSDDLVTLQAIDALIDAHLMPKVCRLPKVADRKFSRCECGHCGHIHAEDGAGSCRGWVTKGGGRRPCPCEMFQKYGYVKKQDAQRQRYRGFAFALLRQAGARPDQSKVEQEARS